MNMGALNCIIVDDDLMSLKLIESLVGKTDSLKLFGSYDNAIDAEKAIRKNKIDLIFLDIEMPEMTGLELLGTLEKTPQVIIVSSKEKYALDSYNYDVTDYLIKPIESHARFLRAVLKAQKRTCKEREEGDNIFIKVDSMLLNFNLTEIHWVEAYGDYVKIHTKEKMFVVYSTLKTMVKKLPSVDFLRVHRSFIVRLDKIKNIDQNTVLIDEKVIPISNSYKSAFYEKINTL